MASIVLTNAKVMVNGVDMSTLVNGVTIEYKADIQEDTAMGDTSRSRLPGLKDWSVKLELNQDFAASQTDALLFPLVGAAGVTIAIKAVNAATSATNPEYQGTAILDGYSPIAGSVGDKASVSVNFQCSNGVALIRAV